MNLLKKYKAYRKTTSRTKCIIMLIRKITKIHDFCKTHFPILYTRPMIKAVWKEYKQKELIGVEIGVRKGLNAKNILTLLNMKMLYLIDPYENYLEEGKLKHNDDYKTAVKNVTFCDNKNVKFILKTAVCAYKQIPNELNFVYIDGNHDYIYVKNDIELYWELLKKGGIIGGHDYNEKWLGVMKAVSKFALRNKLTVHINNNDWWIIKK